MAVKSSIIYTNRSCNLPGSDIDELNAADLSDSNSRNATLKHMREAEVKVTDIEMDKQCGSRTDHHTVAKVPDGYCVSNSYAGHEMNPKDLTRNDNGFNGEHHSPPVNRRTEQCTNGDVSRVYVHQTLCDTAQFPGNHNGVGAENTPPFPEDIATKVHHGKHSRCDDINE